ncbi:acyltransferase [Pseudomonas sp. NFX71]|uniref:acyltransferase n=1 Tax=Pseudomonas sp. NFX71 TaxID=3399121 RepID=UPI003A850E9C
MMMSILNRILVRVFTSLSSRYWGVIYTSFRLKYSVSPGFRFNGKHILLYGEGEISLGDNSYIGDNSTVHAAQGRSVRVGTGCHVSSNVRIFTESAIPDSDFRIKPVPSKLGDVAIGDACWVGANVLINPGVSIGQNSVVGANSVVTRDIPSGEIWGGVPAKLIRKKRQQE